MMLFAIVAFSMANFMPDGSREYDEAIIPRRNIFKRFAASTNRRPKFADYSQWDFFLVFNFFYILGMYLLARYSNVCYRQILQNG